MILRLKTMMRHDARLQYRYGIYAAYGVVVLFYLAMLYFIGPFVPSWVVGLTIFTDPSVLGFYFLGALMMLEKSENTRAALAVTPISAAVYFASKCLTLSILTLIAVTILTPMIHQDVNWVLLACSVLMTSVHYLGLGVPAALHFKTVTAYLLGVGGTLTPIIAPGFIALLDPMPQWAIIIPAASQFKLILIATGAGSATLAEIIAMLVVTAAAAIAGVWLALWRLQREFGQ